MKQQTFICKQSADLPGIKAPIKEWVEKGDCVFIDEVEIPREIVVEWFLKQAEIYSLNIKVMAVDNYRFSLLSKALREAGFTSGKDGNIKLIRPNDIGKVVPVINSYIINHNIVVGDVPVFRWMMNNVKKYDSGNNILYGKIEKLYRKTDTFMAFADAMCLLEEIEREETKVEFFTPFMW